MDPQILKSATTEQKAQLEAAGQLEALGETEGYKKWEALQYEQLVLCLSACAAASTADEALRACGRLSAQMELTDALRLVTRTASSLAEDLQARYEQAARAEFEAGRDQVRRGMRAGRFAAPTV